MLEKKAERLRLSLPISSGLFDVTDRESTQLLTNARRRNFLPRNLLILPLSWLHQQTLVVHFMNITSSLHVAQDVLLKVGNRPERVWNILILLNVPDDFGGLGPFSKVYEIGALDHRWNAVLDKRQVREIYACKKSNLIQIPGTYR